MAGKALNGPASNKRGGGKKRELAQGKLVDIYVWKASTREVLAKITGFHRRAISQLAFSPSGKRLLSIGQDDQNSVAVYDWATQSMLGNAKVDPAKVFSAAWKSETEFSTCGMKHMKTFTMSGANINGKKGSYLKSLGNVAMNCVNYVCNGVLVTGIQNGGLVKWNGNSAAKPIMKHTDAIWAIENIGAQSFVTGGNDGKIIKWNS